jgi:hypothetical protein
MKLTLKTIKPRNPFVAASLRRTGGAHRSRNGRQALRRDTRQALAQEMKHELTRSKPDT